jgi:hypothetical protein
MRDMQTKKAHKLNWDMTTGIDMMIEWLRRKDEKTRAESFVEPHVSTADALLIAKHFKKYERNSVIKYMDIIAFQINNGQINTATDALKEIERIKQICRD